MSGVTVFIALCVAGVPAFVYVFVAFCRDQKHVCRCTCQVTGMKKASLKKGPASVVEIPRDESSGRELDEKVPELVATEELHEWPR